ncbi:energy-coupling factor ABC transporter ATP-binding protein [Corynebacterium terpenotabidum]|uniref:Biotin ABC transport system ATP-binding protein n=1 Tax=Corynebacterium terpenotabidum Y-11 TaxID=1200352 RepID=S4XEG8_9CORY|nr:energy-coupling factor ABC transporter ATP-binding protein [Corynebacterium terpenotabidum]AGP30944.1 biotin ABC transport system ATP-binding protein [Corynebacterium terpenotabidum Y-11]
MTGPAPTLTSPVTFSEAGVTVDGSVLLHPVTCVLAERRISIIGANGSGKSTFIRMINGLTTATTGTVTVDGLNVAKKGRQVRQRVGFLFSDPDNQIIMPTVAEDIGFSLRGTGLTREQKAEAVRTALSGVGLTGKEEQSPHLLSGGEKQMLALASVTALDPAVIVADEPTGLLDLVNRNRLRRRFDTLPQQLIVVTHDLELAADAERTLCIDEGRIIDDGDPAQVISAYTERMDRRAAEEVNHR